MLVRCRTRIRNHVEAHRAGTPQSIQRSIAIARFSVYGNLAMSAWKLGLTVVSPSLFLFVNGFFTVGLAGAKVLAIRARPVTPNRRPAAVRE
ncbi:hypothetical protein GCM10010435_84400 [Winogradskya consettensis]|uniref:Uncharacterized protein n=1 Tax=Winogradskya consettensis TaxID=113560 RepID=A0A919VWA4_9ACTN|nr:hypothetical protein Aco04nite_79700 [Actinoplanes consettensis]